MKLYTYFRSSAAYRVRIALAWKGVAYEQLPIHLVRDGGEQRKPEYLAINPQGFVPALEEGGEVVTQSLAILEYLEETHPEPPLLPQAPLNRARVRSLALAIACDIHPLNNRRILEYLRSTFGQGDEAVDAWIRHWISEGFAALEQQASRFGGEGRHLFGSSVTLADVCLVPQMYNARRFKVDLEPFPQLRAICTNLERLPAFAAAVPEAQPDAE